MPEVSVFDERLAEIDRRLRTIQSGLEPSDVAAPVDAAPATAPPDAAAPRDREAMPPPTLLHAAQPASPPAATPPRPDDDSAVASLLGRLHELQAAHERMLELHRELLSQYAEVLQRRAGDAASAMITTGPFADADVLRAFERALATLPGVTEVAVREYLGADRVALEVRLAAH